MLTESIDYSPCIECSLCRKVCPIFIVLRRKHISPWGWLFWLTKALPRRCFARYALPGGLPRGPRPGRGVYPRRAGSPLRGDQEHLLKSMKS